MKSLVFAWWIWYNICIEKEHLCMPNSAKDIQLSELKDLIIQLNKSIEQLNQTVEAQSALIKEKDAQIERMSMELAILRKKMFGSSSEKHSLSDADQLNFFGLIDDGCDLIPEEIEPEYIEVKYKKEKKKRPTLQEQFKDIPTRQVMIDTLSEDDKVCLVCGTDMVSIGTELVRSEVIYTPPKLERVEYIATTYECPVCKDTEDPQFVKDDAIPPALIRGSYVSASLAAWVFYRKFALSIPFYRQEKDLEELGASISRTSMAHWAISCNEKHFNVMAGFFHRKLLERKFLMMDETPIQVLKEPGRRAQTKSYVWLMRSGEDGLEPIVYYHYAPTRAGANAVDLLKGAPEGIYVMVDGYTGYNKLKGVTRCCCYAHIRRYLLEAIPKGHEKDYSHAAVQGVMYCDKLFEYERRYAEKGFSLKQRQNRRLKDEKPVIEAFLVWLDAQDVTLNGTFAKAITYIKNRRHMLMNYLEDPRCSLSNNLSENSIRPVTLGRKNWLFCDTQDGAYASMSLLTLMENAKIHGISRYKYLKYLLEHRPDENMTDEELEQLAPWNEAVKSACGKSTTNE